MVVIFFSGHGSTIPDDNKDEADGLDEVFVMYNAHDKPVLSIRDVVRDAYPPSPPDMPEPGLVEWVRRAFQRFAEDHPERVEALTLLILEGCTAQEVADYLGRTYGATREYLSQCHKALRPYLLQRCSDYVLPN